MEEIARRLDALMAREDFDGAEEYLLSELQKAEGDDALALSVCNELLGFARISRREALFASVYERTLALLQRVPVKPRSRGTVLINAATALSSFGRGREALPLYAEAERLWLRVLPPRDRAFAALYNNAAGCLEGLGDTKGAEREYRRALGILENYPHDPDRAVSYVNLAQLAFAQGDPRAGELLSQAMEVLDDPEMLWDGYYAHTALKCAPAFQAMSFAAQARDLRERGEIIYEGT